MHLLKRNSINYGGVQPTDYKEIGKEIIFSNHE